MITKRSDGKTIHTKEFKENAIALTLEKEKTIMQIARELGIHEKQLRQWRREYFAAQEAGEEAFQGFGVPRKYTASYLSKENNELKNEKTEQLIRDIKALKKENENLKKIIKCLLEPNGNDVNTL